MFEFSIAFKYLIPKKRQLSVSIISLISVSVISLVVWLILVFFSVTNGMEKNWIEKLVSLSAPLRLTPTQAYYNSYYYQIDSISEASDYNHKSIGEKKNSSQSNPYDPEIDMEPPPYWPKASYNSEGELVDIIKETFETLESLPLAKSLSSQDYEMTVSNLRLNLLRKSPFALDTQSFHSQTFLSQLSYLSSFSENNSKLSQTILSPTGEDLSNLLNLLSLSSDTISEDQPALSSSIPLENFRAKLRSFFHYASVKSLSTPEDSWQIPPSLYPQEGSCSACALTSPMGPQQIFILPKQSSLSELHTALSQTGLDCQKGTLTFSKNKISFTDTSQKKYSLPRTSPLFILGRVSLQASLLHSSIDTARSDGDLMFHVRFDTSDLPLEGTVSLRGLEIDLAEFPQDETENLQPLWFTSSLLLPSDPDAGDGVLFPRSYKESGALLGDRGYLSYYTSTTGSVTEQRLPIFVAGFYDPGLTPIGGKLLICNASVTSTIRSHLDQQDKNLGNGIHVWFDNYKDAPLVKEQLIRLLKEKGLLTYWKVEAYEDYDFAKDFVQQLKSDKTLFSLIAIIITIVACSNIISMLILLVNDKKREIGILQSMGASNFSVGLIFGSCGFVMGLVGSLFGSLAAWLTLFKLDSLVQLLSAIQGHDAFNAVFYGDRLPNELSYEALYFVIITTAVTSVLAGIIPALKASFMNPSDILRSQ